MIQYAVMSATPDGEHVTLESVEQITVELLQRLVGGPFQILNLNGAGVLYVNEEARLLGGFSPNGLASQLAVEFRAIGPGRTLFGNAIALGPPDAEGNDTSLAGELLDWLSGLWE